MLEIIHLIKTLKLELFTKILSISLPETILYFLINLFLAYFSYQIFKLIGEHYQTPKPHTKKLMKFFLLSTIYYFLTSLFKILTLFTSIYPLHNQRILLNYITILIPLCATYIFIRYHLIHSIYYKFKHPKLTKTHKKSTTLFKTILLSAILLDFGIFFYLWETYDITVIYYNILIFFLTFFWIIRHNDHAKKKIYSIYFLLLFLIFNRMNFMFINFSYTQIYFLLDILILIIISLTYITIYNLIKNNKNILER